MIFIDIWVTIAPGMIGDALESAKKYPLLWLVVESVPRYVKLLY
jgi:hypothetical protein